MLTTRSYLLRVLAAGCVLLLTSLSAAQSVANFESPQMHSVALSADGTRLFAVNTPDHRLSVFDLRTPRRPVLLGEVEVGLEPVAVAAVSPDEVWVVNHLSDGITVVDVSGLKTIATLPCSDEPADIVVSGGRAFVSCATEREVLVFDIATRRRVASVKVFADEPRALAVAGDRVYVASARSGNETTLVEAGLAPAQPPPTNRNLPRPPAVGRIVHSEDRQWQSSHKTDLPDWDVFEIDAGTARVTRRFAGVGTILLGIAVQPRTGSLWVTNTEARNLVRFEPVLRGHVVDNRVTRITVGARPQTTPFDLNPGVDYRVLPNPSALATALAQPAGAAWAPDGSELFVAAFGTDRVGVLGPDGKVTARIEIGVTPGTKVDSRNKRGPRALAHHPTERLLYVLNRLSNTLAVVDTAARRQVLELAVGYDPTPRLAKEGRGFLYDAKLSGNGTSSCASCHVDATYDGLAWDLGDPGGVMDTVLTDRGIESIHPMKGPLLTQTMQGLAKVKPLHWRADRKDLAAFNPAFDALMGGAQLSPADMAAFSAFVDTVLFPPNPNQSRDRVLPRVPAGTSAYDGWEFFTQPVSVGGVRCMDCHRLGSGTNNAIFSSTTLALPQPFKVPQLRGIHKRLGRRPLPAQSTSGFGLSPDGMFFDVVDLHSRSVFHDYDGSLKLQSYLKQFDTGLAPVIGLTLTLDRSNRTDPKRIADWSLMEARARLVECDVVVRGALDGRSVGLLYRPGSGDYVFDRAGQAPATRTQIDSWLAAGRAQLSILAVVPGEGHRLALDRDGDGRLDQDEAGRSYGAANCGLALAANSAPELGNTAFALVASGAPQGPGTLFLGMAPANQSVLGVHLLVDLTAAGAVMDMPADRHGVAVAAIPIPNSPVFSGVKVYAQAAFPSTCGPQGVAATNGVELHVR